MRADGRVWRRGERKSGEAVNLFSLTLHMLWLLGARISAHAPSCCYGRGSESGEITLAGAQKMPDA